VRFLSSFGGACLVGCAVTPLTNKIEPGEEPFLVVVGEGPDGQTDLFAASSAGGTFHRLTFSRPRESFARLSPAGTAVAFVRTRSVSDTTGLELVVLDLLTHLEKRAPLPAGAGRPEAVGWSPAGDQVFVRAGGYLASPSPPADLKLVTVTPADLAQADSATRELLGSPPFASVAACPAICVISAASDTTALDLDVGEAFRWGADSLGLVHDEAIEVRPLGRGRPRRPAYTAAPRGLRYVTYHPGAR
jgi:hypothetical protein